MKELYLLLCLAVTLYSYSTILRSLRTMTLLEAAVRALAIPVGMAMLSFLPKEYRALFLMPICLLPVMPSILKEDAKELLYLLTAKPRKNLNYARIKSDHLLKVIRNKRIEYYDGERLVHHEPTKETDQVIGLVRTDEI